MTSTPNVNLKTFAQQYNLPAAQNINIQTALKTAPSAINEGAVDNKETSNGDFITIKGKKLSKVSIISGIAGIIMLGAGILLALKGKVKSDAGKLANQADKMTNEACNLAESLQKTISSITEKFTQLSAGDGSVKKDAGGKILNSITQYSDTEKMMSEFDDNGTLIRQSIFKNGILEKIQEFADDNTVKSELIINNKKNSWNYKEGNIRELFCANQKPCEYSTSISHIDENKLIGQNVFILDDKPIAYNEGFIISENGAWSAAKRMDLSEEGICYQTKYRMQQDGSETSAKSYTLNENGKWQRI